MVVVGVMCKKVNMDTKTTTESKFKIVMWRIVAAIALSLGVFSTCRLYYRTADLGFDYIGIIVGVLAILVTCLVAWNIYSVIDANNKIKEMQTKIENLQSSIASDKLSSERKINKIKAELYDNIVSINRHILGFEKSAVSTHMLINMVSSIDYLARAEEYAAADLQIEFYYVMTKDDIEFIKKDLDNKDFGGVLRLLYEIPNKEKIKNFSKLEELIKLACS